MDEQIALRQQAIQRWLAHESKASIARALGTTHRWVRYWIDRYDPDDPEGSLANRSRAPRVPHSSWPAAIRQQALQSRQMRMNAAAPGYRHALMGAEAIHYELYHLGVRPSPPARTIHHWLQQAGLVPPQPPPAPRSESKPYPLPAHEAVNALHALDLKGPFYLAGSAQKQYLVALRDYASRRVALEAADNRRAETVTACLVRAWQRYGLPQVVQMDNGLEFRGSNRYPRAFGQVVRLCLDLDVEPLFVPPHEPWRNGLIENFNGLFQRLSLARVRLASFEALRLEVASLERDVNTSHRLAALDGLTPDEFSANQPRRLLDPGYNGHQRALPLAKGRISAIRLVRQSGRFTLWANDKFQLDPELKHQYVLAQIDVANQRLDVYYQSKLIQSFDYAL